MFLGLPDPDTDPLGRDMDPDPDPTLDLRPDPSISKKKSNKKIVKPLFPLFCDFFGLFIFEK
jgi:hypothetical protein